MSQQKTVNTFENGMIKVGNPTKQPKNSYPFAFNAIINDIVTDKTSLTNEKSFELYYKPNGETNTNILGYIWLGLEEYVLFIKNIEGEIAFNKIIYINQPKSETRVIYDSLLLNFQDNYEIKGTYRINYKNQRIVYWVDGLNDDRVINIDVDNSTTDISLLSLGESAIKPIITAVVNDNEGSITTGQYFIAMSYNIGETFTTSPYSISNPVSIAVGKYHNDITITPTINQTFGLTYGDDIPVPTTKSLTITTNGLDTKFTSYNLYIIKANVDNTYTIKVIENIPINSNEYKYTGNEGVIDDGIDIANIIVDSVKYYASEAIIQKENRLVRGNSKLKGSAINYQAFANNIKVTYEINEELVYNDDLFNNPIESPSNPIHTKLPVDNSFKEHSISPSYLANTANNNFDNKSFMRDEVYSLGIGFELLDGSETPVFHIPGRIHNTLDNTLGSGEYSRTYTSDWDTLTIDSQAAWISRNTAMDNGTLSYWRSSSTYSDGYDFPTDGEQSGGKSYIRHHRMPSDILEPIFRTEAESTLNDGNEFANFKIYKRNLSLNFSNIEIPNEYKDLISKIKIFYTPRTQENKRVLSKGLLCDLDSTNPTFRQSQQMEGGVADDGSEFEFLSPDVNFKFKENSLSGSKINICSIYKGYIQYVGISTIRGDLGGIHFIRIFNNALYDISGISQAVLMPTINYLVSAVPKENIYSRPLDTFNYVDRNFSGSAAGLDINFSGSQDTSILTLLDPIRLNYSGNILSVEYPQLLYPVGSNDPQVAYGGFTIFNGESGVEVPWQNRVFYETNYYVSIINSNTNLYNNIEDLQYIHAKTIEYNNADDIVAFNVSNGDTFIDNHHVKKTRIDLVTPGTSPQPYAINIEAPLGPDVETFNDVFEFGSSNFISFMCETDINIRMRREGDGGTDERFFPKSYFSTHNIRDYEISSWPTLDYYDIELPYNKNYLKLYFANNTTQDEFVDNIDGDIRYSTRIIYSDKQELEDKTDNYRIVRANNYRDLPLNRGQITLFFTRQDKLYAITRDSLYDVFASNQTIKSETADNIVVGTGEFLGLEPVELISIDGGYGGSSSKFSLVESPFGYLFVDRNKNKCFLFNEQLKDINILGLNENFKLELFKQFPDFEAENGFDNPLTVGIIGTYDPELQRLIITKKDYKLIDDTTGELTFVNGYIYRDGVLLDYNDIDQFENKSFTASFDPINTKWISYHGYFPKNYISHNTDFLIYNEDNELRKSNGEGYDTEFIIETVFNENPLYTKVTDSLNINSESFDGEERTNDFFDTLLVYNDQQSSDYITLNNSNLTRKEKDWNINKFFDKTKMQSRKPIFSKTWDDIKNDYYIDKVVNPLAIDVNKPWYQLARFRDKYLVVRFNYKNLEMQKIIVNFVNSIYRLSQR